MKIREFLLKQGLLNTKIKVELPKTMKFTEEEQKLARFFIEREGEGILEEIREIDFIEAGIIDSLDLVCLAVFIETNFAKKIDLVSPETLNIVSHFDSLMKLIKG